MYGRFAAATGLELLIEPMKGNVQGMSIVVGLLLSSLQRENSLALKFLCENIPVWAKKN